MRDPRKKLAKHTRRRRRTSLVVLMMACSPLMADRPRLNSVGTLPPLPLHSFADANTVKNNPFCEPAPASEFSPIQLASGSKSSSIRLMPIGAAIGLKSIDNPNPQTAQRPAITIEPVGAATVRKNPLLGSTHHANRELVETEVVDQATPTLTFVTPTPVLATPAKRAVAKATLANPSPVKPAPEVQDRVKQSPASTARRSSIVLIPQAVKPLPVQAGTLPVQAGTLPVQAGMGQVLAPVPLSTAVAPAEAMPAANNTSQQAAVAPSEATCPSEAPCPVEDTLPVNDAQLTEATRPVEATKLADEPYLADEPHLADVAAPIDIVTPIEMAAPIEVAASAAVTPPVDSISPATQPPSTDVARDPAPVAKVAIEMSGQPTEEAIFFSFSDRSSETAKTDNPSDISPEHAPETEQSDPVAVQDVPALDQVAETINHYRIEDRPELDAPVLDTTELDAPVRNTLDAPVRSTIDAPMQLGMVEPIKLDEPETSSLKPIESVINSQMDSPIAIYQSTPIVAGPVEAPEPSLHTKRYRPPVAVKQVPIAVERTAQAEASTEQATVQSVKALNLDGLAMGTNTKASLTPLYMTRAQVRSLTLGGQVRGVQVADESICQAVAAGPNQLKLIGTGNGVTRLVVWADVDASDESARMRAFEIHVKDAVDATGEQIGNKAELLSQSIRKAFPLCSVRVQSNRDHLVVSGRCDSEASAKQIIRMVRKTCLIPVQDNLVVR